MLQHVWATASGKVQLRMLGRDPKVQTASIRRADCCAQSKRGLRFVRQIIPA